MDFCLRRNGEGYAYKRRKSLCGAIILTILVVGTLAYDDVETPAGMRRGQLGGSASYFAVAASYFSDVGVVSIVGDDFRDEDHELLSSHGIDLSGVETASGNTFHWSGSYLDDINSALTLDTRLNVFEEFSPCLSDRHASAPYLFLANSDPELQRMVLDSMNQRPVLVAGDTMNHWIVEKRSAVSDLLGMLDVALINEGEAVQFSGERGLVRSADALLGTGLREAVIKRGEYGVALFGNRLRFAAPAFPLADVIDPTGAGDSFAGGFIGYIAATGKHDPDSLRRAAIVGSTIASITVEGFGLDALTNLETDAIQQRYKEFVELTRFASEDMDDRLPLRERHLVS